MTKVDKSKRFFFLINMNFKNREKILSASLIEIKNNLKQLLHIHLHEMNENSTSLCQAIAKMLYYLQNNNPRATINNVSIRG